MNHELNPAELVVANRIRMAFPARIRDILPSDGEIVRIVKQMSKFFDLKTMEGVMWLHESFLALNNDMDEWEKRYLRQRVATYWAKEVAGT